MPARPWRKGRVGDVVPRIFTANVDETVGADVENHGVGLGEKNGRVGGDDARGALPHEVVDGNESRQLTGELRERASALEPTAMAKLQGA